MWELFRVRWKIPMSDRLAVIIGGLITEKSKADCAIWLLPVVAATA
jgi:hypothetical protein